MTPAELRAILARLGLSQVRAAHCLGISDRAIRMWLDGDRVIPQPIARILRMADRGQIALADLIG